jgi:hypothetical protein
MSAVAPISSHRDTMLVDSPRSDPLACPHEKKRKLAQLYHWQEESATESESASESSIDDEHDDTEIEISEFHMISSPHPITHQPTKCVSTPMVCRQISTMKSSHMRFVRSYALPRCYHNGCCRPVKGPRSKQCTYHADRLRRIRRQYETVNCTFAWGDATCKNTAFRRGMCKTHYTILYSGKPG